MAKFIILKIWVLDLGEGEVGKIGHTKTSHRPYMLVHSIRGGGGGESRPIRHFFNHIFAHNHAMVQV